MRNKIIPIGTTFNFLTVKEYLGVFNQRKKYLCSCVCGDEKEVLGTYLTTGDVKSCGCQSRLALHDLNGRVFGRLTVLNVVPKKQWRQKVAEWVCQCECGEIKQVIASSLLRGNTQSCGCLRKERLLAAAETKEKYEEIPINYLARVIYGAEKRKLTFEINMKDLWDQFIKQERKCALTGLPIGFCDKVLKHKGGLAMNGHSASLDRIDANKGYEVGNIQWVTRDLNFMKQDFSMDQFIEYCKLVVNNFA